jgi:hypothetical protein
MEKRYYAPEELLSKFKSKLDMHKYMTIDRKRIYFINLTIVGLYLPSYSATTLEFMRDLLSKKKQWAF